MSHFVRRVLAWLRRGQLDEQLREELAHHLAQKRQALIDGGMDAGAAEAAARRAVGNTTRLREQARDLWGFPTLDGLALDLRFAVRMLARSPSSTCAVILSLTLGIGAAAAAFAVADAVLFRPLPVAAAHDLYALRLTMQLPGTTKVMGGVEDDLLRRMRAATDFADLVGYRVLDEVPFAAGGATEAVRVEAVSGQYFHALGVTPRTGRLLDEGGGAGSPLPVVISERLWRRRFDASPAIAGQRVSINGVAAIVTGVAAGFRGLVPERPADVFAPAGAAQQVEGAPASTVTGVVIRLRDGVEREQAEHRIAAIYRALAPPGLAPGALRITLEPAWRGVSAERAALAQPFTFGLVLAGVLLLVACANACGLLLTRYASRRGEFGIRIAIGAGRLRLARQLAAEAALVGLLGGVAGLAVAAAAAPALTRSIPLAGGAAFDAAPGWRVVAFTIAVTMAVTACLAFASVFRLARGGTAAALQAHARTLVRGKRRAAHALIAAQVACTLLLVVTAGAMLKTLENLRRVDPGFDTADRFALSVDASALALSPGALPALFSTLQERIRGTGGVAAASFAQVGLMTRAATTGTVDVPGRDLAPADRLVRLFWVGPGFLEASGMRLLAGSGIGAAESAGRERVAVVNEEFARFYLGGTDRAVGRILGGSLRIIGVASNARYSTLRDEPVRAMFVPHTQAPPRQGVTFVVKPAGDSEVTMATVTSAVRGFDRRLKVSAAPLGAVVGATVARERFVAMLAAALSGIALFLACAGLYAAVAHAAAERRPEMAIRAALGATGRDVLALMLREPLRVTLLGVAAGAPASYFALRGIAALLFGVAPFDAGTLAAGTAVVVVVAIVAAALPARRAAGADPQECLKVG